MRFFLELWNIRLLCLKYQDWFRDYIFLIQVILEITDRSTWRNTHSLVVHQLRRTTGRFDWDLTSLEPISVTTTKQRNHLFFQSGKTRAAHKREPAPAVRLYKVLWDQRDDKFFLERIEYSSAIFGTGCRGIPV